jgi:Flp pilus assembly protein TadG
MTSGCSLGRAALAAVRRIPGDRRATAALEFAIVALPFLYILLGIMQMGLYYMAQAALDSGVNATATNLRNSFNSGTTPVLPTGTTLKSNIVSNSGGIISNTSSLAVDLRALTALDAGAVPITDGTVDSVTTSVPIVLRAQFKVVTIAPGFPLSMTVASAAILRFSSF